MGSPTRAKSIFPSSGNTLCIPLTPVFSSSADPRKTRLHAMSLFPNSKNVANMETMLPPVSLLPSPNSFPSFTTGVKGSVIHSPLGRTVSKCASSNNVGFLSSKFFERLHTLLPFRCTSNLYLSRTSAMIPATPSSCLLGEGVAIIRFRSSIAAFASIVLPVLFLFQLPGYPVHRDAASVPCRPRYERI